MIMHMGKKIVCVKDIPSNVIEEAIFILKSNATNNNQKLEEKSKKIILDEAESIVDEYAIKIQEENNLESKNEIDKLRKIKQDAIYLTCLFIAACIFISIVI